MYVWLCVVVGLRDTLPVCGTENNLGAEGARHLAEAFKRCPQLQTVAVGRKCGQVVVAMIAGGTSCVHSVG